MLIKSIELNNFRNYKNQKIIFDKNINVFYGNNAQGKTNIIEAIFVSSFGKSFRTNKDKELIKNGEDFSNIKLEYENKDREGNIKVQLNENKNIFLNDIKIKKLSELLGIVNIVLFTPDDINILKEGPSKRRKFLNMMIGQIRPNYIYNLNMYLKVLDQRNNYLKKNNFNNIINEDLLSIWDEKLAEYGSMVAKYREEYINKIKDKIQNIHNELTENKEKINIKYLTDSLDKEEFIKLLKNNRKEDLKRGFTTKGIQKDDFVIYINDEPLNIYGSQGQHRTAILNLKLCELNIVKEEIGENPILLLDDFMSELDENRINNFFKYINDIQVIITCTKEIKNENIQKKLFYVNNAEINLMKEG